MTALDIALALPVSATRRRPWRADMIERAMDVVECEIDDTRTRPGRRADLVHLKSVFDAMWTGSLGDDDLGDWIERYDLAEAMGIDLADLRRRGAL